MRHLYFAIDGNVLSPPLVHEGTWQEAKHLALEYAKTEFPEWILGFIPQIIVTTQESHHEEDHHGNCF